MSESGVNLPQPEQGLSDEQAEELKGLDVLLEWLRLEQELQAEDMVYASGAYCALDYQQDKLYPALMDIHVGHTREALAVLKNDLLTTRSLLAHLQAVMQRKEHGIEIERRWRTDAVAENARLTAALAEAEAGLKHIGSLARRTRARADQLLAEGGGYTTTYDELVDEYQALKRPSKLAYEALERVKKTLAKAQAPQGQQGGA